MSRALGIGTVLGILLVMGACDETVAVDAGDTGGVVRDGEAGDTGRGDTSISDTDPRETAVTDTASGDAGPPIAIDYRAGTFQRATEASYRTGALAWAAVDEIRFDDPGDGSGPQLLIEGGATNRITALQEDLSGWTFSPDTPDVAVDAEIAPDGEMDADRYTNVEMGRNRPFVNTGEFVPPIVGSIFCRRRTGTAAQVITGQSGISSTLFVPPFEWGRFSHTRTDPGTVALLQISNHFGSSAAAGITGDEHAWWGAQLEDGAFPTTYIRNGLRSPDVLIIEAPPSGLRSRAIRLTVWPSFASDELDDRRFVLLSFGGPDDVLWARADGFEVVAGGTPAVSVTPPSVGSRPAP